MPGPAMRQRDQWHRDSTEELSGATRKLEQAGGISYGKSGLFKFARPGSLRSSREETELVLTVS